MNGGRRGRDRMVVGFITYYLCNQCQSPLTLWVQILLRRGVLDTTLCDKVCQWFASGRWFSPGTQVSSTNKTDHHDITEILLKVVLNTITLILVDWMKSEWKLSNISSLYILVYIHCTIQYINQIFLGGGHVHVCLMPKCLHVHVFQLLVNKNIPLLMHVRQCLNEFKDRLFLF